MSTVTSAGSGHTESKRFPHKTTERIVAVLECLAGSRRGMNISEIARKLEIPKSSVHAIVLTLEARGFLSKGESDWRYHLGGKAIALGRHREDRTG
jgi:DNA-binding IclR family transcriptional regulator